MSVDRGPTRCGLYLPGHEVHVIQALRSGDDNENPPDDGRILDVRDEGVIEIDRCGTTSLSAS